MLLDRDGRGASDHLVAIDTILTDRNRDANALALLAEEILRVIPNPPGGVPVVSLFQDQLPHELRRFIAASMLRLLSWDDSHFDDAEFRISVVRLFDAVLNADVYPALNVRATDQTYEKLSKLKDAAPKAEESVREAIELVHSVHDSSQVRQRFMQALNSVLGRLIIRPFLPSDLVDSRLKQILDAVAGYVDEEGPAKHQKFNHAVNQVEAFSSDATAFRTLYSRDLLGGFAERLRAVLVEDLQKSPLGKPADLSLDTTGKKYPLRSQGSKFAVSLIAENRGDGPALGLELRLEVSDNLSLRQATVYLGRLEPHALIRDVEFPCEVLSADSIAIASAEAVWSNGDNSTGRSQELFELEAQPADLDWEWLETQDPYSLEPITSEMELVGRRDILSELTARAKPPSVSSSYVFGQKRVGKTSLVQTLASVLQTEGPDNYLVVYLDGGDYVHPDATTSIEELGRKLCAEVRESDPNLRGLAVPEFQGALSPLADFLRGVERQGFAVLFILDEFDELPLDLYKRGSVGDAFFLTIRSISAKPPFGFILVGGEKMEFILSSQGDTLNKFQAIRVDYFDRGQHWNDFQDLVRKPVADWFEISDEALTVLYESSAGNPFFTKLICNALFRLMTSRRDGHVTASEAREAVTVALGRVGGNQFQHFWEDGIFETAEKAEEVSMRRRRVLLALGSVLRKEVEASEDLIIGEAAKDRIDDQSVRDVLKDFARRQVLVTDGKGFSCKVPFFEEWLKDRGVTEIITTFTDLDAVLERRRLEEETRIKSSEILRLTQRWGPYLGKDINEDRVRTWLEQFHDPTDQRLMLRILNAIRFYSQDLIRAKLKEAHGIAVRGLRRVLEEGKLKRSDILVSYLDQVGKSGAHLAKLYADENGIYAANVVERSRLANVLESTTGVGAVVFVDDLIGTGGSASKYFSDLAEDCGELLRRGDYNLYLISIVGFRSAIEKVDAKLKKLKLTVRVHSCDPLGDDARCFDPQSSVFPDEIQRERAREVAESFGRRLEPRGPLGFGNTQALVAFEHGCPNNTLPILWKKTGDWHPLFPRI